MPKRRCGWSHVLGRGWTGLQLQLQLQSNDTVSVGSIAEHAWDVAECNLREQLVKRTVDADVASLVMIALQHLCEQTASTELGLPPSRAANDAGAGPEYQVENTAQESESAGLDDITMSCHSHCM